MEEAGVTGEIVTKSEVVIKPDVQIIMDLHIKDKNTAFKVMDHAKLTHDVRFVEDKTVLDSNKILLLGDESYTLSK